MTVLKHRIRDRVAILILTQTVLVAVGVHSCATRAHADPPATQSSRSAQVAALLEEIRQRSEEADAEIANLRHRLDAATQPSTRPVPLEIDLTDFINNAPEGSTISADDARSDATYSVGGAVMRRKGVKVLGNGHKLRLSATGVTVMADACEIANFDVSGPFPFIRAGTPSGAATGLYVHDITTPQTAAGEPAALETGIVISSNSSGVRVENCSGRTRGAFVFSTASNLTVRHCKGVSKDEHFIRESPDGSVIAQGITIDDVEAWTESSKESVAIRAGHGVLMVNCKFHGDPRTGQGSGSDNVTITYKACLFDYAWPAGDRQQQAQSSNEFGVKATYLACFFDQTLAQHQIVNGRDQCLQQAISSGGDTTVTLGTGADQNYVILPTGVFPKTGLVGLATSSSRVVGDNVPAVRRPS